MIFYIESRYTVWRLRGSDVHLITFRLNTFSLLGVGPGNEIDEAVQACTTLKGRVHVCLMCG